MICPEYLSTGLGTAYARIQLERMMDEANRDDISTRENEIQKIWNGAIETSGNDPVADGEYEDLSTLRVRIKKLMSHRDLLRGAFRGGEE